MPFDCLPTDAVCIPLLGVRPLLRATPATLPGSPYPAIMDLTAHVDQNHVVRPAQFQSRDLLALAGIVIHADAESLDALARTVPHWTDGWDVPCFLRVNHSDDPTAIAPFLAELFDDDPLAHVVTPRYPMTTHPRIAAQLDRTPIFCCPHLPAPTPASWITLDCDLRLLTGRRLDPMLDIPFSARVPGPGTLMREYARRNWPYDGDELIDQMEQTISGTTTHTLVKSADTCYHIEMAPTRNNRQAIVGLAAQMHRVPSSLMLVPRLL